MSKNELSNVDAKDIAILRALDQDVRASFSEIGKQARTSKEVVQYRIKQLEENKIITGYWAHFKLQEGTTVYKVLLKNRSLTAEKKEEFVNFVLKQKMVSWFANTEGNFDYVLTVIVSDDSEFAKFLQTLFSKYSSYFQERHILKTFKASITNEKYLYPNNEFKYNHEVEVYDYALNLDETDKILIKELSLNSRIKYTEIAKKANLTAEAISSRYKKLVDKLNVRYKVRINTNKLGLSYYHIFIRLQNQEIRKELIAFYTMHPACNATLNHLGFYDLHLEFMCPSSKIQDVVEEFSSKFGNSVSSYELLHIREEYTLHIIR
jgi:Lrp/AsnC family transcriptional regulator, leucine-responsive regulatory protein